MNSGNGQFNNTRISSRMILLIVFVVLFITASILVFVFRDDIANALGTGRSSGSSSKPFTFTSGSEQVFDSIGNGLVVASTNGIEVIDSGGREITKELMTLSTPAIVSSNEHAAVFDVDGSVIEIVDLKGNMTDLKQDNNIITVTMNEKGWLAVCTDELGYNGKVTVYNKDLDSVYEWYSGEGYLLTAKVSPDSQYLATLTVTSKGGAVHILKLDSEIEVATYNSENEFLYDLDWISNATIASIGDDKVSFIGKDGKLNAELVYDTKKLTDFAYGDGFAVLMLSDYGSGDGGTLVTVGEDGATLGKLSIENGLEKIDVNGKYVAFLSSNGVSLYTQSMSQVGTTQVSTNVKDIVLRNNEGIFVLTSNSAEIRKF